ncbi:MAG: hypothetical protein IEMM0008_1784 [bacterium]|nr:MAG: hypothetical protein IEMM0008_1784 [bacterium]
MRSNNLPSPVKDVKPFFLGFLAEVQGQWDQAAADEFRSILETKGFTLSDEDFKTGLEQAKVHFYDGDVHLFICTGKHCNPKFQADSDNKPYQSFQSEYQGEISLTKCQNHCEEAPSMTLRIGQVSKLFIGWGDESKSVFDFLIRASKEGTLEID